MKWEITGGSCSKGKTAKEGARRELQEETGICVELEELLPVYTEVSRKKPCDLLLLCRKGKKTGDSYKAAGWGNGSMEISPLSPVEGFSEK